MSSIFLKFLIFLLFHNCLNSIAAVYTCRKRSCGVPLPKQQKEEASAIGSSFYKLKRIIFKPAMPSTASGNNPYTLPS